MKKILILKNTKSEGPGTLQNFFDEEKINYTIIDLCEYDYLNINFDDFDCLIILGGPMSVNDYDKINYLNFEIEVIKKFAAENKTILGICLGAQLIAKSFGAKVFKGARPEIGWYDIKIEEEGIKDCVFAELLFNDISAKVFQWHGETFDLPASAVRLASSELYENQAFRLGKNIYALQFHIEVTGDMIFKWLEEDEILKKIIDETEKYYDEYIEKTFKFYRKLFFGGILNEEKTF